MGRRETNAGISIGSTQRRDLRHELGPFQPAQRADRCRAHTCLGGCQATAQDDESLFGATPIIGSKDRVEFFLCRWASRSAGAEQSKAEAGAGYAEAETDERSKRRAG